MTFRTIDIDTNALSATNDGASLTTRHARSRRRSAIMTPRRLGSRMSGFGF